MKIKMIFKKIYLVVFLALAACSDSFLDHPITGSVSDDNIGYVLSSNPLQIEKFLGNAYRTIAMGNLNGRFLWYALPEMAHEVNLDYLGDQAWNEMSKNDVTSVNSYVTKFYGDYYKAISITNLIIDLIDKLDLAVMTPEVAAKIKNCKGEALFIRAYCHFNLLQLFGEKGPAVGGNYPANKDAQGIVLMLSTATAEDALSARSTVGQCYDAILADLQSSDQLIQNNQIPANTKVRKPGSLDDDYVKDIGWAQKPAVHALMGKVYLYMNDYTKAKTEFQTIISDSRFKLDRPVNFSEYIQHNDNSVESIFSLQYYYYNGPADAYSGAPSNQINRIHTNVPGAWVNTFVDARTFARFGNDPRIYEATLYDKGWSVWSTATTPPVWITLDTNSSLFRCYPRKYIDFFNTSSPRDATKNVEIIRLADVYLMYAEACLQSGDVSTAKEYVNKLRRRAWGEVDYNESGSKGEDLTNVTLPVLQEERYKELFFENSRWFDLCRWGILQQELAKYPSTMAGVVTYDDKDFYLPIPESELNTNVNLKQSKGY